MLTVAGLGILEKAVVLGKYVMLLLTHHICGKTISFNANVG